MTLVLDVTWAGLRRYGSFARTADEPVMKATKSEAIMAITDRKQSKLKLISYTDTKMQIKLIGQDAC